MNKGAPLGIAITMAALLSGCGNTAVTPNENSSSEESFSEIISSENTAAITTAAMTTASVAAVSETGSETVSLQTETAQTTIPEITDIPIAEDEIQSDYRAMYRDFLYDYKNDENNYMSNTFSLFDIDSDGIPELFISTGDFHAGGVKIYTVYNNEVVCISGEYSIGSFGTALVTDKYVAGGYTGQGVTTFTVYSKKDDKLIVNDTFYDNEAAVDPESGMAVTYKINDIEVTAEEYEKAYYNYNFADFFSIGCEYELCEYGITEALFLTDNGNNLGTLTDEMKSAYYSVLENDFNGEPYALYLGDINNDGLCEMIAAYNMYNNGIVCYYSNDRMKKLELEVMSDKGYDLFLNNGKLINKYALVPNYSEYMYAEGYIYEWDGNDYTPVLSLKREAGTYNDDTNEETFGQAYINGVEVSNEDFEKKFTELEDWQKSPEMIRPARCNSEFKDTRDKYDEYMKMLTE